MLKKMGWEGAGLGAEEQGIQEPVKGGDVRDKMDKYKVGVVTLLTSNCARFRTIEFSGKFECLAELIVCMCRCTCAA
jgi:hypothetical protein